MSHIEFWLRLLMVDHLRATNLRQLCSQITADIAHVDTVLYRLGFTTQQKQSFYRANEQYLADALHWLQQSGNFLLTYADENYPGLLRHIKDPPFALFGSGNMKLLNKPQLAMVGRRNCSRYGEQWGRYFATELSLAGLIITSGLAFGIDSICHQAVLDTKGKTIAVLGSGLAQITPRRHQQLADKILNQDGLLVSEFLPTEPAIPQHFPRRNRIISGLSQGVFVVEAALRSGSLITAKYALEQGREVFALPGPIGNEGYHGTHWLIQQGATLVTHPSEIIEYLKSSLNWLTKIDLTEINDETTQLTSVDELPFSFVLDSVGDEVTSIDDIAQHSGLTITELASKLIELELAGYISAVQGGYVRNRMGT